MLPFIPLLLCIFRGIGLAVTRALARQGATVVMACSSKIKCDEAAEDLRNSQPSARLITLQVSFGDLASVRSFAKLVSAQFDRLDLLVHAVDAAKKPGSRSVQQVEGLLGHLHLSSFALTQWLLPILRKPLATTDLGGMSSARVINVVSIAFLFGSFHPSLVEDEEGEGDLRGELTDNCPSTGLLSLSCCPFMRCPHTNGYARAKLANVLHAVELQRRLDEYAASRR